MWLQYLQNACFWVQEWCLTAVNKWSHAIGVISTFVIIVGLHWTLTYCLLLIGYNFILLPLQPFYAFLDFVQDTWVNWYQKKHSPTHTYPDHQSSFICFLHLLRSVASSLFNLHARQSFLHNLCPSLLWSTPWCGTLRFILHTFLHPIIVFFSQHMFIPYLTLPIGWAYC